MGNSLSNFKAMLNVMEETNATVMHQKLSNIEGEPDDTTFVLSVYKGQRTDTDILEALEEWATRSKNQELLDKIGELSRT